MRVLVTVDDTHLEHLGELQPQLIEAGLLISEVHELSGIIAGEVADSDMAKVRAVDGVLDVEAEPRFSAFG